MTRVAVVGLGPWGLAVVERLVDVARRNRTSLAVEVVQPGTPGSGVYSISQPDYLILNNACGQLSSYAMGDGSEVPYGMSFYEWVTREGYRWLGDECDRDPSGRPIDPSDFLPRRLMGEYLQWFYRTLTASLPPNIEIRHHDASALDVALGSDGREVVVLSDGRLLAVDHVVLTTGHTENIEEVDTEERPRSLRPYPVSYLASIVAPSETVAVSGMGLVAFDVLAALTTGRGGRFVDSPEAGRLRYIQGGTEPTICLYSRSGVPYCAKATHGIDPTGSYDPVIFTATAMAALARTDDGLRRELDFRNDLLPLIVAEMQVRFHAQRAQRIAGDQAARHVVADLEVAWQSGTFAKVLEDLEAMHGTFLAEENLFAGSGIEFASSDRYQAWAKQALSADLDEALDPMGSPVKAAQETTRILRDRIRGLIEFGGLSAESYVDFCSTIRGRLNRLEAGPPAIRSQQLLALMEAGVVRIPFGPNPRLRRTTGGVRIESTQLDEGIGITVDRVIRGHLDMPSLANSQAPLLRRLVDAGRMRQMHYRAREVGSVCLDDSFHPIDLYGRSQERLWILGVLTEGTRYFTHYLPSPQSRLRAILDADLCARSIVS